MNHRLEQFRTFKVLPNPKSPRKTNPGLKLGRLLDCRVALFFKKANLIRSTPRLVPWGVLVGHIFGYAREKVLGDYEPLANQNKENDKQNNLFYTFCYETMKSKWIIKTNDYEK